MDHQTKEIRKRKTFSQLPAPYPHKMSNKKGSTLPHIAQNTNLEKRQGQ
jgi:LysM repeat protein